jgi:hypothetical protein
VDSGRHRDVFSIAYVNYSKVLAVADGTRSIGIDTTGTCKDMANIDAVIGENNNPWINLANKLWFA